METRIKKRTLPFTQIDNTVIIDWTITDSAYRLYCYIEMQSDWWKFYKNEIKKKLKWGEEKYTNAMKCLKDNWYISHYPVKELGKIVYRELSVLDKTIGWESHTMGEPGYGKPPVYNKTNKNNTNLNNNKDIYMSLEDALDESSDTHIDDNWWYQDNIQSPKQESSPLPKKEKSSAKKERKVEEWIKIAEEVMHLVRSFLDKQADNIPSIKYQRSKRWEQWYIDHAIAYLKLEKIMTEEWYKDRIKPMLRCIIEDSYLSTYIWWFTKLISKTSWGVPVWTIALDKLIQKSKYAWQSQQNKRRSGYIDE